MIVIYKIVTFKMTRKNIQEFVDFLFFKIEIYDYM